MTVMGAREVSDLVKRLPCKYKDLNLIFKIHIKMSGVMGHAWNPSLGRQRWTDP